MLPLIVRDLPARTFTLIFMALSCLPVARNGLNRWSLATSSGGELLIAAGADLARAANVNFDLHGLILSFGCPKWG
jgi:hypothetical protein